MANYVTSGRQLSVAVISISILVSCVTSGAWITLNYLELPEVQVDLTGKCLKVINYKNGDAFACQDRDVTLRRYRVKT
jgi:hypothetical protein